MRDGATLKYPLPQDGMPLGLYIFCFVLGSQKTKMKVILSNGSGLEQAIRDLISPGLSHICMCDLPEGSTTTPEPLQMEHPVGGLPQGLPLTESSYPVSELTESSTPCGPPKRPSPSTYSGLLGFVGERLVYLGGLEPMGSRRRMSIP